MTDGVARELEQAEARLESVRVRLWDLINAELRSALENGKAALSIRTEIVECIERDWPDAAVEVGRLRAFAEVAPLVEAATNALTLITHGDYRNGVTDPTGAMDEGDVRAGRVYTALKAALAAREEAQP